MRKVFHANGKKRLEIFVEHPNLAIELDVYQLPCVWHLTLQEFIAQTFLVSMFWIEEKYLRSEYYFFYFINSAESVPQTEAVLQPVILRYHLNKIDNISRFCLHLKFIHFIMIIIHSFSWDSVPILLTIFSKFVILFFCVLLFPNIFICFDHCSFYVISEFIYYLFNFCWYT